MFELMQALLKPALDLVGFKERLADLADPFGRVRKIENTNSLGTMKVNQTLDPFCPISRGSHELGMFKPPSLNFDQRQTAKFSDFKHPRKVGNLLGLDLLSAIWLQPLLNFTNGHRFDFSPLSAYQRDHRPVRTKLKLQGSNRRWRDFSLQVGHLLLLERFIRSARPFGLAAAGGFADPNPQDAF
jgi:hypothetical protein